MDWFDTAVEMCGMVEIPRWGSDTPGTDRHLRRLLGLNSTYGSPSLHS
jgi:hypothetical protein